MKWPTVSVRQAASSGDLHRQLADSNARRRPLTIVNVSIERNDAYLEAVRHSQDVGLKNMEIAAGVNFQIS